MTIKTGEKLLYEDKAQSAPIRFYKYKDPRDSASINGQVMLEAIVAIGIATVGLLGIFSLASRSLSLNRVVASQYIGVNLAAEGIELVKNLIDRNAIQEGRHWNEGITDGNHEIDYNDTSLNPYSDQRILFDSSSGRYSYDSGSPSQYRRKIMIDQPTVNEIKVISLVNWTTRGGGQFSVNLEDHFYNWR